MARMGLQFHFILLLASQIFSLIPCRMDKSVFFLVPSRIDFLWLISEWVGNKGNYQCDKDKLERRKCLQHNESPS